MVRERHRPVRLALLRSVEYALTDLAWRAQAWTARLRTPQPPHPPVLGAPPCPAPGAVALTALCTVVQPEGDIKQGSKVVGAAVSATRHPLALCVRVEVLVGEDLLPPARPSALAFLDSQASLGRLVLALLQTVEVCQRAALMWGVCMCSCVSVRATH